MSVAELIFSVGSALLTIALIPTMLNRQAAVPRQSSILTATVLSAYVIGFLDIAQLYSAVTIGLSAAAWWFIVIFRAPKGGAVEPEPKCELNHWEQLPDGTVRIHGPIHTINFEMEETL